VSFSRHTFETQLNPELQTEFAQQACPPPPQLVRTEAISAVSGSTSCGMDPPQPAVRRPTTIESARSLFLFVILDELPRANLSSPVPHSGLFASHNRGQSLWGSTLNFRAIAESPHFPITCKLMNSAGNPSAVAPLKWVLKRVPVSLTFMRPGVSSATPKAACSSPVAVASK
jgi:hypothetical protein